MANTWRIAETGFSAKTAKAYEGLFTQGSGYLHVRGSIEEHFEDTPQNLTFTRMPVNVTSEKFPETKAKWGTYVPGVYGKHPLLNWELINLPWFLEIIPTVGGERLDMDKSRISGYSRQLDLATGTLTRSFTWHTSEGDISVRFERFVSAARKHLCFQQLVMKSDKAVSVTIAGGIDADVRTNGYDHFTDVQLSKHGDAGVACKVTTDGGDDVHIRSVFADDQAGWTYQSSGRRAGVSANFTIAAGGELTIDKRSAITTSRDLDEADPESLLADSTGLTYADAAEEHAEVWNRWWSFSDVVIGGDESSQLAMRCSIYHLLRAHVPDDARVAIDAKGYAGDAYFGRFFWDTEMYLLPFFLYTDPRKARTFVDFRVHTLPGAKATAASYGYPGARYPWESDSQGNDCCPCWQYRDHEVHVTADVVYGMMHYAMALDYMSYLTGPAGDVIVETARYWMKRMDWREGDDGPSLLGVMGPDEYSPLTSNNSYTNRMVAMNLSVAAKVGPTLSISEEECEAFEEAAKLLPILLDDEGLVHQCEEFHTFAEPNFDALWKDRSKTFAAQVSQERLYRSKCLKQGDVIMLMTLFPREFTDEMAQTAWDYYLPYTTHDSSLSAGAHAIVACRLGLEEEAWKFWQMSSGLDLDIEHGAVGEGIHIAAAGANWQIAVMGFAGMATALDSQVLTLNPKLPAAWSRLAFPIIWKRVPMHVDIDKENCSITNGGPEPVQAVVSGQEVTVPGEGTVVIPLERANV